MHCQQVQGSASCPQGNERLDELKTKSPAWEDIAKSNLSEAKEEVLPILKLSYMHLSPEMKQCFAFCAVFPKDYEIEKSKLIQLWIANGFIL
jgi:hypothetical protein